jgi:predicted secreted hydrolase
MADGEIIGRRRAARGVSVRAGLGTPLALLAAFGCLASARAVSVSPAPAVAGSARPGRYAQALAPRPLVFPRDQGPHPDFRQEWWYLTGNLDSASGERFGFELTFFRLAIAPPGTRPPAETSPWRTRQIYLGHFAVTDAARHRFRFAVRTSRGALGLAGAQAEPFRVWIDDWRMSADPARKGEWHVRAAGSGYALSLTARALQPPVANGDRGLSRKSAEPGDATYYYSIPRVAVHGTLMRNGRPLRVRGLAWLDREWGSGGLGPQETGWEWFGLELGDGASLMFYSLRDRDGGQDPFSAGTWVLPDGRARSLGHDEVRIEALDHWTDSAGVRYPSRWRVLVPRQHLALEVTPLLADQELVTSPRYWEGAVNVSGTRAGKPIEGRGYVELVGFQGPAERGR